MKPDDFNPDLRRKISDLPREIPPARNLWPEIQAEVERLDPKALDDCRRREERASGSTRSTWIGKAGLANRSAHPPSRKRRNATMIIWSSRKSRPTAMAAVLSQAKLPVSWMPTWKRVQITTAIARPRRPPKMARTGATSSAAKVKRISQTWKACGR